MIKILIRPYNMQLVVYWWYHFDYLLENVSVSHSNSQNSSIFLKGRGALGPTVNWIYISCTVQSMIEILIRYHTVQLVIYWWYHFGYLLENVSVSHSNLQNSSIFLKGGVAWGPTINWIYISCTVQRMIEILIRSYNVQLVIYWWYHFGYLLENVSVSHGNLQNSSIYDMMIFSCYCYQKCIES